MNQHPFPDGNLSAAENYCRTPGGIDPSPWCYTTDVDTRWEFCDVPPCSGAGWVLQLLWEFQQMLQGHICKATHDGCHQLFLMTTRFWLYPWFCWPWQWVFCIFCSRLLYLQHVRIRSSLVPNWQQNTGQRNTGENVPQRNKKKNRTQSSIPKLLILKSHARNLESVSLPQTVGGRCYRTRQVVLEVEPSFSTDLCENPELQLVFGTRRVSGCSAPVFTSCKFHKVWSLCTWQGCVKVSVSEDW